MLLKFEVLTFTIVNVGSIADYGKSQSIRIRQQTAFFALFRSVCWGLSRFFEPAKAPLVWLSSIDTERQSTPS